jgi:hypothetical protein
MNPSLAVLVNLIGLWQTVGWLNIIMQLILELRTYTRRFVHQIYDGFPCCPTRLDTVIFVILQDNRLHLNILDLSV